MYADLIASLRRIADPIGSVCGRICIVPSGVAEDGTWIEGLHPRDKMGRFEESGGGGSGSVGVGGKRKFARYHEDKARVSKNMSAKKIALTVDQVNGTDLSGLVDLSIKLHEGTHDSDGATVYYKLAKPGTVLKKHGLTGEYFTIRRGVITKHFSKNENHALLPEEWIAVSYALTNDNPKRIIARQPSPKGNRCYRIETTALINGRTAVVGAEVKLAGRDIEVNSVETVFGKEGGIDNSGTVIYPEES